MQFYILAKNAHVCEHIASNEAGISSKLGVWLSYDDILQ